MIFDVKPGSARRAKNSMAGTVPTVNLAGSNTALTSSDLSSPTSVTAAAASLQGIGRVITGTPGNDVISARSGNNLILGLQGQDRINGGPGDDIIYGNDGNDEVNGFFGNDTLYGGNGDDTISGGPGSDNLYGEDGNDVLDARSSDSARLYGGRGNDILTGGSGNDLLNGGKGADVLDGGRGDNVLQGGNGNDRLIVNASGVESLDGGNGFDTAVISARVFIFRNADGSITVQRNLSGENQATIRNVEFFEVDGVTYWVDNLPLSVISNGTTGNDQIAGGAGNDLLYGDAGDDILDGGAGSDVLDGNAGSDVVNGGLGDDTLRGAAGNDVLDGGDGDDVLTGGGGNDVLSGGAGNDLAYIGGYVPYLGNQIRDFIGTVRSDGGIDITRISNGEVDTLYNVEQISIGGLRYGISIDQGNVVFSLISPEGILEPRPNETTPGNRPW